MEKMAELREKQLQVIKSAQPPPSDMQQAQVEPQLQNNLGNWMMQKMGWKVGQGLGPDGRGIVKPLQPKRAPRGAGIGRSKT